MRGLARIRYSAATARRSVSAGWRPTNEMKQIETTHCQSCGRTDSEYVGWTALAENDGYTACCNARAVSPYTNAYGKRVVCDPDECSHD